MQSTIPALSDCIGTMKLRFVEICWGNLLRSYLGIQCLRFLLAQENFYFLMEHVPGGAVELGSNAWV